MHGIKKKFTSNKLLLIFAFMVCNCAIDFPYIRFWPNLQLPLLLTLLAMDLLPLLLRYEELVDLLFKSLCRYM